MIEIKAISDYDNCVGGLKSHTELKVPVRFNNIKEMNDYRDAVEKENNIHDPISLYFTFKEVKKKT